MNADEDADRPPGGQTVRKAVSMAASIALAMGALYLLLTEWGPFPIANIRKTAATCVTDATPVVEGICRYREAVGLWPETVEDLVPDYLDRVPAERQANSYSWGGYDASPMVRMWAAYHIRVVYFFPRSTDDPEQGWQITCEGDPLKIDPPPTTRRIDLEPPITEGMRQKMIRELERRIQRSMEHPNHGGNVDHKAKLESVRKEVQSEG